MLVEWVDTNWDGSNGRDRFRDSMLDFIFTAQGARDRKAVAMVIVRAGGACSTGADGAVVPFASGPYKCRRTVPRETPSV